MDDWRERTRLAGWWHSAMSLGFAPEPLFEPFSFGNGFSARGRKRQPGRARSPAKPQPCGQWRFGVDDFGVRRQSGSGDGAFGRTDNICEAKNFRACESGVALRLPPQSKTRWRAGRAEGGRPRPQQCPDGDAHSPIRCRTVLPRCCARGRAHSGRFAVRRRKRQPGRARSPAKSQPCGQWRFGVDERGKGRFNLK